MIFKHVTHKSLVKSILVSGLLPSMATGAKRVWLTTTFNALEWSIDHVSKHHGWNVADMRELTIVMPRTWSKKSGRKGVRWCFEPIAVSQIADVRGVLTIQG
jgi:hypothetical protein